jgi:cyclomaltodextrinase
VIRVQKMITYFISILLFFLISAAPLQNSANIIVPDWSTDAVWYQIFPERFWNGDPTNDPTLEDIKQGWPYLQPKGWQTHPWNSDWYQLQPWELANGLGFYQNAAMRRYGGDLQGVLDRLPYLQELGVNAIYFNPLFESPSHHKYDASMYHHIDNNFGPAPEKDKNIWQQENPAEPSSWQWTSADSLFLVLIQTCHQKGIKVIIDGVFNHVGYSFWAFQDVLQQQKESPFADWFIVQKWDDPATEQNEFVYQGWNGVRDLPEIREDEKGLSAGFAGHVQAILKRWMDPNSDGNPVDGIDGWRLDVAEKVHPNFWREFRKWVKEINPQAYLVGEIWWEDWARNKMFNAAPWLQGDLFDGVMNYRWGRAIQQLVIDVKQQITVNAFIDSLQKIYSDYPQQSTFTCQNLLGSHDMERLASQVVNPDRWLDHGGNPQQNISFNVRKPRREEQQKQKLAAALQMTLPGAPMIYYGDEAGMWGGDDPDCRKPMIWPEIQYEPESSHPFNQLRPTDEVVFDQELFDWYRKLIQIRKSNDPLSVGSIKFLEFSEELQVLGFIREYAADKLLILANPRSVTAILKNNDFLSDRRNYRDLIGERLYSKDQTIKLNPWQILILREQ